MIKIDHLGKYYDEFKVIDDVSIEINKGEIYGLIGMSGAGKSTILRCINGLTSYQEGSLKVQGQEVANLKGDELRYFRKNIGMIFQHFALLERRTAYQNIAIPMESWGYDKNEIKDRVEELLTLVGLKDKGNRLPRNLSGGEKQRVAIARALTMSPEILLCDEATSSLDPSTTIQILELLKKINEELDITIVVVTHQMEVITQLCDKVSILENGKVNTSGETSQVFGDKSNALMRLLGHV